MDGKEEGKGEEEEEGRLLGLCITEFRRMSEIKRCVGWMLPLY